MSSAAAPMPESDRRLEVLLLYVQPTSTAGTIGDHVGAFSTFSRHNISRLQNYSALHGSFGGRVSALPASLDLDRYDVLVLHYSNYLLSSEHFDARARDKIAAFTGLKVLFLQDEYRQVNAISTAMRELGIHVLFTCVPEDQLEKVYPAEKLPRLTRITNLTGYVPAGLQERKVRPIAARPIDVGYRARQVPFWLGRLGAEKWQIAPKFLEQTSGSGLRCDISYQEADRLYGRRWINFMESCRSVLGTESGASVFDFDGRLQQDVERYVAENPVATFEEVEAKFLREHEGRIRLNQISPRCFEAAALRTAMVLYEGHYSGILKPERHFIPLRKDFSNVGSVIDALRDHDGLQQMVDRTYREIVVSGEHSYAAFIRRFDETIEREIRCRDFRRRTSAGAGTGLTRARVGSALMRGRFVCYLIWFRIFQIGLGAAYWLYVRVVPEAARNRLRPHIRRILFRGQV